MNKHCVQSVDEGSLAEELGICPGDFLCRINGEAVEDVIDYESLSTGENVLLSMETAAGEAYEAEAEKDAYEPLGLNFASGLMSSPRVCKNHCVFCFIDQLPKGGRETLHVKDDDWRLSLIMGNYVSLTNVDEAEFARILARRVSPLYISVHAINGAVRKRIMNNPHADELLSRLTRLKEAGLRFDAQIVLCPGLNDKAVLEETLAALYALQPAARSVAVVPVGLTKFREGLYPLRPLTRAEAAAAIEQIEAFAARSLLEYKTALVFASDELYLQAGRELPPAAAYEDFCQIENGVGLLRRFEEGFMEALSACRPLKRPARLDSASGLYAAPFMRTLFARLRPYGIEIEVHGVENRYFGGNVAVSGLLTGEDLCAQLGGKLAGAALLLPHTVLRERDVTFLDGKTVAEVEKTLGRPVWTLPAADGEAFVEELFARLAQSE